MFCKTRYLSPSTMLKWYRAWKSLPKLSWIAAACLFREGDFRKAADLYKEGIRKHPKHPAVICAKQDLAYCLYKLGKLAECSEILKNLMVKGQASEEAYLLLMRVSMFMGDIGGAFYASSRGIECYPADKGLIGGYAQMVSLLPESVILKEEAFRLCETALSQRLDEDGANEFETGLALLRYSEGAKQEAEDILVRVLAEGRAPYEAILLRGQLFLEQHRFEQARFHFSRATKRCAEDPRPVIGLAKSYILEGEQILWAIELAKVACNLSAWQNPEAINLLIEAMEASDQTDDLEIFKLLLADTQKSKAEKLGIIAAMTKKQLEDLDMAAK